MIDYKYQSTETAQSIVEKHMQQMFVDMANEYELTTGDIAPEQAVFIEKVSEQLSELLCDYVVQNEVTA
jgi:hypothetical protein